ncbi:MAG: hypothetical protein V2A54_07955, partial [Bacteroidota bacterium]
MSIFRIVVLVMVVCLATDLFPNDNETASTEKTAKTEQSVFDKKAGTARMSIAVLDLYATFSLDKEAALLVSDRIRTELIKTDMFEIRERDETYAILERQLTLRLDTCNNKICMAEAGQVIGTDRLIYGSIANVKGFYTVVLRLLNVPRVEILNTVTVDISGDIREAVSKEVA